MNKDERALESLAFIIEPRNKDTEPFNIDLCSFLNKKFINFVDLMPNDEKNKKSVRIEKDLSGKKPKSICDLSISKEFFSGKISTTGYGEIQDIVDTKEKAKNPNSKPVYTTTKTQGAEKSFYFLIYYNKDIGKGMIMLESYKNLGVKQVFNKVLNSFLQDFFPEYRLKTNNVIDKDIISQTVKNGDVRSIKLVEPKINADTADKLGIYKEFLKDYKLTVIVESKSSRFFPNRTNQVLRKVFDDDKKSYILGEELTNLGFGESSEITVNYNYNNSDKNIIFDNPFKRLRTRYKVLVNTDVYGKSDFKEINKIAIEKLKDICPFYNK